MRRDKKNKNENDNFREKNGYGWDYVIVFRVYDDDELTSAMQRKFSMKMILSQLSQADLETRLHYSLLVSILIILCNLIYFIKYYYNTYKWTNLCLHAYIQRKLVFCKIRAKLPRLLQEADRIDFYLPTSPKELERVCKAGREGYWKPLRIPDNSPETTLSPYESIYLPYKHSEDAIREMMMIAKDTNEVEEFKEEDQEYNEWLKKLSTVFKRRDVHFVNELVGKETIFGECFHCISRCFTCNKVKVSEDRKVATRQDKDAEEGDVIKETILRGIDRVKLISSIIKNKQKGGAALDIEKLLQADCIVSSFTLHDYVELHTLEAKVLKILQWPWNLPIDDIKDYFGEKIGLYYSLLNYCTAWLLFASVITFFLWIDVAATNDPNASTVPYIAVFISVWATLFLQFWGRKEKYTAMRWGMCGFESTESERPSFEGKVIQSAIDGSPTIHVPVWERAIQSIKSYFTILGAATVIVGWLAIIFLIRKVLSSSGFLVGIVVSSIIFAILIQLFNPLYMRLAVRLNDKENHRTDTEYEDALISKMFIFQFINSYSPLFYIAFFKPFSTLDPCEDSCMLELEITLGCLFLFRLTYNCLSEVVYPLISACTQKCFVDRVYYRSGLKEYDEERKNKKDVRISGGLTDVESSYLLPEYNHVLSSCADYSAFVIQFGYTTMFVAAFPLAPLAAFVCNYIQLRIDSWKLCQTYRRPMAQSAEDIGQWYYMLELISYITAFTNAAVVTYTGTFTNAYSSAARAWIFILFSVGLVCLKLGLAFLIPDTPQEVEIQLLRQQFIEDKLERNLEDTGGKILVTRVVPKYIVNNGDDDPL